MLLKWLFLLFLAWYIFRAAGNLINAARQDRQQVNSGDNSGIHVQKKKTPPDHAQKSNSQTQQDIEDARYQDL